MAKPFANSGDPHQAPHSAVSDLDLHCLPITLLGSPDYNGLIESEAAKKCWDSHFSLSTALLYVKFSL